MNLPCLIIEKIINFSSQRDMWALTKVFEYSGRQTKIICPFCVKEDGIVDKLFLGDETPWFDKKYYDIDQRASQITLKRQDYADDSFEVKMRSIQQINNLESANLGYKTRRYREKLNILIRNRDETIQTINKILQEAEIFVNVTEFIHHISEKHDLYSTIFRSMIDSHQYIASFRRNRVGFGIVLEGYAGDYRSVLTQTIIQGGLIMVQDKLTGTIQKHKFLPESLHRISALRDYLECLCDAAECKRHYTLNSLEYIEAERYYGRANTLRLICNSILRFHY